MVARWRPDGTIHYCNEAYARQCELPREAVLGRSLFELTPPDELSQILGNIARLTPERPVASYDHRIPGPAGRERWQEWIDQAFYDEDGRVVGYQSTGRDITARKLAEERLRRSQQRLHLALVAGRQRVWEVNLRTGLGWLGAQPDGGPDRAALRRTLQGWLRRLHPEDRAVVAEGLERLGRGEIERFVAEHRARWLVGGYRWFLTHAVALERDAQGRAEQVIGTTVDIDARRRVADRLRDSEERLRLALEAAGLGVWELDLAAGLFRLERAGLGPLGRGRALRALSPRQALRLVDGNDRKDVLARFRAHRDGRTERLGGEQRVVDLLGGCRWVELHGVSTERDEAGRSLRMVGVVADVTARKEAEFRLATLALEDHLTGLPNRRALDGTLERALAQGERTDERVGILLLDLDGFKAVNDRLGHLAGDELLAEAADRLRACVRRSDAVARFGGDEFAVVAAGARTRRQLERLARRIGAALGTPVDLAAGRAEVRVSIGIAVFPEDGTSAAELLGRADSALYAAKRDRSGHRFAAELAPADR